MTQQIQVILYTDQVNSTGMMAKRTPLQLRKVWNEQVLLTEAAVKLCNGEIVHHTGDGHQCRFYSVTDATLCGCLIQKYVNERNLKQAEDVTQFAIYVGLDAGEVSEVGQQQWRGNVMNLAARVTAACPSGEVYLTNRAKNFLQAGGFELQLVEGQFTFKGVEDSVELFRVANCLTELPLPVNPFRWRGAINDPTAVHGRSMTILALQSYIEGKQNAQIVGPHRIGKSSLLKLIEARIVHWLPGSKVAYVDLSSALCRTPGGLLKQIAKGWDAEGINDLASFERFTEMSVSKGKHCVILLDEFGESTKLPFHFAQELRHTLRSCGEANQLSTITVSSRPLSELVPKTDPSSPWYNTFALVTVADFSKKEALEFLNLYRPGLDYADEEKSEILRFAVSHPLKLMSACYHVLLMRQNGGSLEEALEMAGEQTREALR